MENISKTVVSQDEGRKIGYVLDIAIGENLQKTGYYVVDEESEGEFFVSTENIVGSSSQFLLVKDMSSLEFVSERKSLLGKILLDDFYQNLGVVRKILFKGKRCVKVVTERCEISPKNLQIGTDFAFVSFKRKTAKHFSKNFPKADENSIVKIQDFQPQEFSVNTPETIRLSSGFYVGRVSTQDIFGYNNEKIVLSGEVITRAVVEKAKRHNKLNQLFFAIKR